MPGTLKMEKYKSIRRIFADPYYSITTHTLEKIAKALGVTTSQLIEDEPDEPA
jgi:DNA-binding Xre family transcriptional regulator